MKKFSDTHRRHLSVAMTTHGESSQHGKRRPTPEYRAWQEMKARCYRRTHVKYQDYGARGITVCARWVASFQNFLEDMGRRPGIGYSLDRKETNGNYEKDNCRWATGTTQSNNKRNNRMITFNGETLTIAQWSVKKGISYWTLYNRLTLRGWPVEKALTP